jgi:hypothetical protein
MQAIEALPAFKGWEQWQKESGRFIPSPDRFLSEKRWERLPPAATLREKGNSYARRSSFDPVATAKACGL